MRRRHVLPAALVLAATLGPGMPAAQAQTFDRVTTPGNPIVTDTYQSGGGCWMDLLGDGFLDLFVANGNLTNQPNALYRNTRTGSFVRVVTGPVALNGGSSIGGTVGDFDNDGLADLFVTNRANFGNFLYRGLGDTLFARVTTGSPVTDNANSNSSSWVDMDGDGNLDLYVVDFQGGDFLYHGDGPPSYTFTRVDTSMMTPGTEFSIPGAWADFNGDGLEDAFVGNAGVQNDYLYVNHGHLWFTRQVIPDGLSTLGASWGDYDNDGWLDLLVAHYSGQPSTLYRNSGPPSFTLTPVSAGVFTGEPGNWVGSAWGDYDNDGALDLYVSNDGGLAGLYHNAGPPSYALTRITTGPIGSDVVNAFGAVWGDYDRDGQLDLFVADHLAGGNRLYHNGGTSNHWLTIRCQGTTSNRSAIGAKVRVRATIGGAPRWQLREVTSQTGYNSANLDQHFGLGDASAVDSLRIEWPSGRRDTWANLGVDSLRVLSEGAGTVGVDASPPGPGDGLRLEDARPNPCRGGGTIAFELPRDAQVHLDLLDISGRRVARVVDDWLAMGRHDVRFALPAGTAPGVYFGRLAAAGETRVRRVAIIR